MRNLFLDSSVRRLCLRHLHGLRLEYCPIALLLALTGIPDVANAQDNCSTGSAYLRNYVPQAGIAGITRIYISGRCFGAAPPQGGGIVSIGGVQVPSNDILQWTDDEIVLVLPETAQTGPLEVDSDYGQTTCPTGTNDYGYFCGTSEISGALTVFAPAYPSLYGSPPKIDPAGPSAPQYVQGTWNYNDGFGVGQYVFSQGARNSNGAYDVSGSIDYIDMWGNECSGPITGSLNTGVLVIHVPDEDNQVSCGAHGLGGWSEEWLVLNSGDATSQGWATAPWNTNDYCSPLPSNYPQNVTGNDFCFDVPLFKSQTDLPATESPQFLAWLATNGSQDATYGAWQRTLPLSPDGLVEFSGRFVFEQTAPGGGANDQCYQQALTVVGEVPFQPVTGVTGGGWFVNTSGVWGSGYSPIGGVQLIWSDDIGINSDRVMFYQQHLQQCSITIYQTMFIDSVAAPTSYNSGGPNGSTNQIKIVIDNTLGPPLYCTGVIPSAGGLASACEQYPPE